MADNTSKGKESIGFTINQKERFKNFYGIYEIIIDLEESPGLTRTITFVYTEKL